METWGKVCDILEDPLKATDAFNKPGPFSSEVVAVMCSSG